MDVKIMCSEIVSFLSQIKWDNILSLLFGALISGYISYNFLKRRERDKLKKDLQVKAAEQILEEIRVVNDKASMLFIPDFTAFQGYNSTLECAEKNISSENDLPIVKKTIEEIRSNQLQQAKDRARKCMDNFFDSWKEYSLSFCRFINSFETKLIVLNVFIGIKELLGEELMEIMNIENKIMHLYHFDINGCITYSKLIDVELINQMQKLENELQEKKAHIVSIFYDLKVGLQNEFLGELFDFRIQERQPKDKERYPVYRAGYEHTFRNEIKVLDENPEKNNITI